MTRTIRLAMIAALALAPSLLPASAGAQSAFPQTRIVAGGMLPPNGSEGGLQSEASLPPGAAIGTEAWVSASIVDAYIASQEAAHAPNALAAR